MAGGDIMMVWFDLSVKLEDVLDSREWLIALVMNKKIEFGGIRGGFYVFIESLGEELLSI